MTATKGTVFQGWDFPAFKGEAPMERYVKLIISPQTTGYPHGSFFYSFLLPGATTTSHIHDEADEIMFIVGRGKAAIDGEEFELQDGSVVFSPRGCEHEVRNTSNYELLKLFCVFIPAISSPDMPDKSMLHQLVEMTNAYLEEEGLKDEAAGPVSG
jgi:mannose-6-phosphate isomerase-like protein (cupin superfamily)